MNRLSKTFFTAAGISILAACGGGSSEPADAYVGAWRSACYSYVGNDGNTYFKRLTNNFSKASATSLNVTFTDSTAHSDPACNNVLGVIPSPSGGTIQLGPKASFLGGEVDSISATFPSETLVGYMTVSASQLFIVADAPNITLTGWGVGSPYSRTEAKQAPAPALIKSSGDSDGLAPATQQTGYSR
ncbi:hypothetical protein [Hydrogenophaga sp. RWCD_12]|uniref:hypothetical protein n=1 Tax=Hydrogenophaga sp. RWCD_12 TaxID=3391190 RepID=UPI0039855777